MTKKLIPLKHVAMASSDPDKSRDFFVNIMGWSVAGVVASRNANGYYVTDGNINLAILNFKNGPAAGKEFPQGYVGLHHIGFQCDDIEAMVDGFKEEGYQPRHDVNLAQGLGKNPAKDNAEYKMNGPEDVMVDISERGWVGTQTYKTL
ncbi:VOC family protein [Shewanella eurypsychrophilus]|uniref:VOC family protein n=1 Tax=Shewanella eurypsychrophilus TaxID=2593656 RepID=A0ABX6V9I0_9GAMM|nr:MULTISPECIES: VOC family protein [Shewanella]QFU24076.1 VOC family protein [Shewanella sp. YLB-09]QPG59285.1 VOC family protein [Shewanella eurypsychrophilus]